MSSTYFRKKYALGVLPTLALGFLGWLFWPAIESQSTELGPGAPTGAEVEIATEVAGTPVTRADLSLRAQATGYTSAWRSVDVTTEMAGKVAWRGVRESQSVEEGAELLHLQDDIYRIELAEAEADLLKAKAQHAVSLAFEESQETRSSEPSSTKTRDANLGLAEHELDQESETYTETTSRHREFDSILDGSRRVEVRAAVSGLAQAEQRAARARLSLERTRILAPFAGRIAEIDAEIGQNLPSGHSCLVLLDESRVKVEVDVLGSDIVWLRPGVTAEIRVPALDDQIFEGKIHTISPQIDPETGTGRVTVAVTNHHGRLMPGLFAFAELEVRRLPNRITVPADALLSRQGRELVFRLEDGHALWTYVKTGVRAQGLVEIVEGLSDTDIVAVGGHLALAHEATVTLANNEPVRP